ncbi:MAG: TonB-dependent receptor, partial [Desulfobacterales bacterium]|nr:TonB-dependent receptor [Desulfobacterales bacterium]
DMDLQHDFTLGARHKIIWGMAYRWTRDHLKAVKTVYVRPTRRTLELFSVFIQDQVTLVDDKLWLILGSKFEESYYTGWEVQPTGRLLWKPREGCAFWAAVSRAARTPSIMERDGSFQRAVIPPRIPDDPGSLPTMVLTMGNDAFSSENLIAYEAGFRFKTSERFACDISAYYNVYDDLTSHRYETPVFAPDPETPHMVAPLTTINAGEVRTRGLELAADFLPLDWSRLRIAYTWQRIDEGANASNIKGHSPEHRFSLRSSSDLPYNLELDLWARYIDDLTSQEAGGYATLDIRLGWSPAENLAFSLVGRNLLEDEHTEFRQRFSPILSTAVERGVYGKATWRF